jgi:hypothetical protein
MSAIAFLKISEKTIIVKAKIHFYGTYAKTELAEKIVAEINSSWNSADAEVDFENTSYQVRFEIEQACLDLSQTKLLLKSNQNYDYNFIRLEEKNVASRSMMGYGLGENAGHWLISDNLGESTTASHEFGHALGLPHPTELDYRNTGLPPIMAPRGTLVDAIYQWNPLAEIGQPGATMKPVFRKVKPSEVAEIFKNLVPDENLEIKIGKLSNYFFNELGQLENINLP